MSSNDFGEREATLIFLPPQNEALAFGMQCMMPKCKAYMGVTRPDGQKVKLERAVEIGKLAGWLNLAPRKWICPTCYADIRTKAGPDPDKIAQEIADRLEDALVMEQMRAGLQP